jgi:hypothetical protein
LRFSAAIALLALLGCGLPGAGAAAGDKTGAQTLRIDYFHTGGKGVEVFAVDRVVLEPLPWPDHPDARSDDPRTGAYRFEVRREDGGLLLSRGYSSIFAEWVTTAEAASEHRTFHESLRFPAPDGPVRVSVLRRAGERFEEVWSVKVDPGDMFVQRAAPPPQQLIEVERNGPPPGKVDVLLIGDGYTAAECSAKFRADARRMAAALFRTEPFATRRSDFNVWGLCPPAAESGVSRPSTGLQRRSPVGSTYDAFGSERYVLTFDNRSLRDVAAWAPYEYLTILVNAETYGGGGIHGAFSTVAVDSEWADYLFVHEFGHHFAALADEYYTSPVAYQPADRVTEPWEPNVTALLEPSMLKWRDLVEDGTPVPTPWPKDEFEERQRDFQARRKALRAEQRPEREMNALFREEQAFTTRLLAGAEHAGRVGAFRGANYDAQAYYRSQLDCVMFSRDQVPFCRVCSRALETIIDLHAGTSAPR